MKIEKTELTRLDIGLRTIPCHRFSDGMVVCPGCVCCLGDELPKQCLLLPKEYEAAGYLIQDYNKVNTNQVCKFFKRKSNIIAEIKQKALESIQGD